MSGGTSRSSLRARLDADVVHVMATHSPLSARLAEEAGFEAVWASGFELSALYGVPDASLLGLNQHLDMTRAIAGQVAIPVVADLDTGYGNAVNVRHVVREYRRAGAAAVVIEDKTFPKTTSLLAGGRHTLVPADEFAGKLAAAREAAGDDVLVIGRTEALIAGLGLPEALARAAVYARAGADLILVHSKRSDPVEIDAFVRGWDGRCPLVIVPTAFPAVGPDDLARWPAVRMVIYGNHAVRASVSAMQAAFRAVRTDRSLRRAESLIAPLDEVLRLQRSDELASAERRFLNRS